MSEEVLILIVRKILIPFFIFICFYFLYKNRRTTLDVMFLYVFNLFTSFTATTSFRHETPYDIFDKFLILLIYPLGFILLSRIFFKTSDRNIKKERNRYIRILIFFIIAEALYIFNIFQIFLY